MKYPKIYLTIDNCFASKRWTRPVEWMKIVRDLGITYIEASADNECDPLYADQDYLKDWIDQVRDAGRETGARVVNLYSGHGTYATLGLGHHDERNRDRMLNNWLKGMLRTAGSLSAGLGFFCHAFSQDVLQSPRAYSGACDDLYERLSKVAEWAHEFGVKNVGIEQMYTPHQLPWTISGARELMTAILARTGKPFYITIDTGHQTGQSKFLRPSRERIMEALGRLRSGRRDDGLWLGPESAFDMATHGDGEPDLDKLSGEMDKYPHLFSRAEDGDTYEWLEKLGRYSPIIHLQQTTGLSSAHLPFSEACNRDGIIKAEKLLNALARSYEAENDAGLPRGCEKIYMTLEIFAGTAELPAEILGKIKDSVSYWRGFIPDDGLTLDKLL